MTSPVSAEQVVDVDTWVVQVTLDPAQIIEALAEILRIKGGNLVPGYLAVVRHLPADHPERQWAYDELRTLLADVFTWTLTAAQADEVGGELYEAGISPEQCHYCESYSVVDIEGVPMCHRHAAWHDRAVEESAS
jgi:hypothetical protein